MARAGRRTRRSGPARRRRLVALRGQVAGCRRAGQGSRGSPRRLCQVGSWSRPCSPLSLVVIANPDRNGVQREQDHEQDDDRPCSDPPELLLRPGDVLEDLHGKRREIAEQRRVERDARSARRRGAAGRSLREPGRERESTPSQSRRQRPGSTWRQTTCHCVAPSAYAPSRIEPGTARIASRAGSHDRRVEQRQDERPGEQHASEPEPADEKREPENPVDDRRHSREVLDIDLEPAVVPTFPVRVLLEIDGGADADGDGEQDQQDAEEGRREIRLARRLRGRPTAARRAGRRPRTASPRGRP